MKLKKILLFLILSISLAGCTNINKLNYEEVLNLSNVEVKNANTFKKGYNFYVPKGLSVIDGGANYNVIDSSEITYYLYADLIKFVNKEKIEYENNTSKYYSQKFNYDNKLGYLEISLRENNQYFIEIMYNYAKIEVMVDKELINKALINSISILRSITYDEAAINNMMSQNDLSYTEEEYELFDEIKNNSNILEETKDDDEAVQEEVKDTDYIN